MTFAARGLRSVVRGYQRLREGRPSPCRYVPSCSTYAVESFEAHGAVKGSWYATRRLLRCHPWGGHGYDPVPTPAASGRREAV
jgi:putative membrane protein insertion efficiency factor